MADIDVGSVLSQLTLREKSLLTAGLDFWHTVPIPRLNIPSLRTSDGPNGVRGTRFFDGVPAACFPCSTALGATFDHDLLRSVGRLIGQEAKAKGVHILLGPTVNIQRAPIGGRGFESFSEDPFLSGTMCAQYCNGVQEEDIITTPKHFVCNDQEHERMAVNSIVTDRALREIYLMPFMLAIKNARPAALMTAYNKVNGIHASENPGLYRILREEWKWEGLVMSDWFGTYSTSDAINAGLDLEMPGPTRWRGEALPHAATSNKIKPHVLDERVRAVLQTVKLSGKSGIRQNAPESKLDRHQDRILLRRTAAESLVLLKNEHQTLPLDKSKPVAIIGPNAKTTAYSGGGSASLLPYYTVTPFNGMVSHASSDVHYTLGAYGHKQLPLLGTQLETHDGNSGFIFRVYDKPASDFPREIYQELHLTDSYMLLSDHKVPNLKGPLYYIDIEGFFVPAEDGLYDLGLTVEGTARLFVDDKLVVDNATRQRPGTAFFGNGTMEETAVVDLKAGQRYAIKVEFGTAPTSTLEKHGTVSFGPGGLRIGGCKRIDPEAAIAEAVGLASRVGQVVLFAGLNGDWEGEGADRPDMDSPANVDKLIESVLAVNPKAVIVLQSGTPVTMPWVDQAGAIVQAWFGGNETGNAIADVIWGEVNPCGKLPITFPRHLSQNPAFLNFRSEGGRVLYGEDVYVGYRYYEKLALPPLFPFGHGLSYTTFEFSDLQVSVSKADARPSSSEALIIAACSVENTGLRQGAEVVQVYIQQQAPSISRPVKELKGFKKVFLQPGEKREVQISMERKYACSFWDEGRDMWIMEKGQYTVLVGNSSQADFLEGGFEVRETGWWSGL
ncbi:MAG: hypothetical protein Q9195_001590 [Heterodermia aff. obscurata]